MIRMQFDGSSRAEAVKECSKAVEKLMEYMPVTTQDDTPPPPNQPPTEVSAPVIQVAHFTSQYIKLLYIYMYLYSNPQIRIGHIHIYVYIYIYLFIPAKCTVFISNETLILC